MDATDPVDKLIVIPEGTHFAFNELDGTMSDICFIDSKGERVTLRLSERTAADLHELTAYDEIELQSSVKAPAADRRTGLGNL